VPTARSCIGSSPHFHLRCASAPSADACWNVSDRQWAQWSTVAVLRFEHDVLLQSDAVTEAAALREGEYVAVRRFTRLLEGGAEAKAALDQVCIPWCRQHSDRGLPCNLRIGCWRAQA